MLLGGGGGGGGGGSLHLQTVQLFSLRYFEKSVIKKFEIYFMPKGSSCKVIQF